MRSAARDVCEHHVLREWVEIGERLPAEEGLRRLANPMVYLSGPLAAFLIELDHTFGIFNHHLKTIRHDSSDSPLLRRVFPIAVILFYLAELISATVSGTKP